MTSSHKNKLEDLYEDIKFPEAIDWWAGHNAKDELDVAISNARHLDATRQTIENKIWRRIVPVGGQVLDLACGRGFFSWRLMTELDETVKITGIDLSETILRVAKAEQKGIPFVLGNAEALPFPGGTFDAILVISAFEHMEDPLPIIEEIYRVLKPLGYLYLCLHKPFIDPFVLSGVAKRFYRLIGRLARRVTSGEYPLIGYKGTLRELRRNLRTWLSETGFERVESRTLLHQLDWGVYKMAAPWSVPYLIRLGQQLNRLPLNYYKNLEYWLLRKQ